MRRSEIPQRLKTLGIPVKYSHFSKLVKPPFAVWLISDEELDGSDDTVLFRRYRASVELYTAEKDFALQSKIEALFDDAAPFEVTHEYIHEEEMFMTIFEFELIERIGE